LRGWRRRLLLLRAVAVDDRNGGPVVARLTVVPVLAMDMIVVVIVVTIVVTVVVMVGGRRVVRPAAAVFRDAGTSSVVVFAQAPDGYAGVRLPARAAHALHRGPVVIMLARRQPAALHQEQRAPVRVQQHAHVLQDLVAQRPHVQLVAYVFHLSSTHAHTPVLHIHMNLDMQFGFNPQFLRY